MEHPRPWHLRLTGFDIRDNFYGRHFTDPDIVDAVIRLLSQSDETVEIGDSKLRWRHVLESDFGVKNSSMY